MVHTNLDIERKLYLSNNRLKRKKLPLVLAYSCQHFSS